MPTPAGLYRFGPFELRPRTRELYKSRIRIKLRPQAYQLLQALVVRAGDVLTREELRQQLWSTQTFVDFEQSLNTAIKELRGALNDSASKPRYIETLPKLGYRMLVAVECAEPAAEDNRAGGATRPVPPDAGATAGAEAAPDAPKAPRWRAAVLAFVAAAVVLAVAGVGLEWSRSSVPRTPSAASGRMMLAVLPFANLTGDASEEYFSDGLTEEMITQLGNLDPQKLGVIARTSVMHYKNDSEDIGQIGRELGVQYVLEGSVRRDSGNVRVSAQLIQVKDQTHLWAREYDRQLTDLLSLQTQISQEVAEEIQLPLGGEKVFAAARPKYSPPKSYESYDLYLKGLYFWNKRTASGFQQAARYFQQAIDSDPNYARAYAGLADAYALMSSYDFGAQEEFVPKARAAALRAVQLDDSLAEAHTSLGLISQDYDWDWQKAESEYRRAIELDPSYSTAHHWYAENLVLQGRFDEAFAEMARARELDPLSLIISADYGAFLYFSRQYDRATQELRAVLEMEPNFPRAHVLAFAYVQQGNYAEAVADVERWRQIDDRPWTWAALAYVYGRSGRAAQAQAAIEKLKRVNRGPRIDPGPFCIAYVGNDNDKALAWLAKARAQHAQILTTLKVDPVFDPLRADPRFRELLHTVGLAQ
jgi:TolB-like protein/DNA-binding winged helix-turn-helix (wHTH) protein/Tfp pilus assembly protein PilF